ncbi:uncharacterized protein LOC143288454 [Babylonia areolata]|uniref:uncharacterized protein LOC143288454 n=1 Tax=Babylonia areolata TaxID=304850 RepID=UPI003FD1B3AD
MRRKVVHVLIAFGLINVVAVLIFYGWIVSRQLSRQNINHVSDVIIRGKSGITITSENIEDVRKELLTGHTLKPLRQQQQNRQENIPPVPEFSKSDYIAPLNDEIVQKYQTFPDKKPVDSILILTPIHDVAGKLKTFLHLLQSITYPHHLISIAFGEDSSHDNTLHIADDIAVELRKSFVRVDIFHFNLSGQVNGSWSNVHNKNNQFHRRRHLAQARNALLRASLKNQDWVLWIDSDISFLPPDIVQKLLSAEKDIVVPVCIYMDNGKKRVFDKNTWRETKGSLSYQQSLSSNDLMLEGYDNTKRLWLSDLKAEGRVVPIDGVGGCTLLIRSECHKNGLIFPESIYQHHIETEGLAKLAKQMGYDVYGMPFLEVTH